MRKLAERAWFGLSVRLGRLLRAGRYSEVRIVQEEGAFQVRKQRAFYAPVLVWLGGPLVRILDTGMRVLPQQEWEVRERLIYAGVHDTSIRIDAGGTLVLPYLHGQTLATLLANRELEASSRTRAIELAVIALAGFHRLGFTHGDAMAENVMVDLEAGAAHWFDFETVHDVSRPYSWRQADDVRALLGTCLLRTDAAHLAATLHLILDAYADENVTRLLSRSFTSAWQRALPFHLGQAALSFDDYREVGRLLSERAGDPPGGQATSRC